MRLHPLITLMLAASALAACDLSTSPTIAGLGGGTGPIGGGGTTGGSTGGTTSSITVLPNQAQLVVGGSVQLSTNAPLALQSQIQWGSLQPTIVAVSPSGLATAVAPGSAVIVARFAFDTTQTGSATITVIGGTTGTGTP